MGEMNGIGRIKFHPGKADEYKRLAKECVERVRVKDSGTLRYDIYLNDDETEAVWYESYRDSAAVLEHFANMGELMKSVPTLGEVSGEIFGNPSAALRKQLERGGNVKIYAPLVSLTQDG